MMPDSRLAAARLGIELPDSLGYEFRGIRFHGAGRQVESNFPRGRGMGVRRTALHAVLVRAAEQAGVELRWDSPVADIGKIGARWIVGADGASSRVRRWAELDACVRNSRRYAYRQHFAIAPWTDCMEVYWGEGCQIYVTPVAVGEVCVALISRDPHLRLEDALQLHFPGLHQRLEGAATASRERGSVTATVTLRTVARGNVALIGDASGSVDAITGEGLCLSFRQAEALAKAMVKGNLSGYNRAHPRISLRTHLMAQGMLLLDRGSGIRRCVLGTMSAQPWIFRRLLAFHVL
jgi:flavin-dependent dehydrogenase